MRSPPQLQEVAPDAVDRYLEAKGWTRFATMRTGPAQWTRGDRRVLVPQDPDLDDYAWMVERVVTALAKIEGIPSDILLLELANPEVDVLRVIIRDGRTGGRTSLAAATAALTAIRGMLEAAAWNIAVGLGISSGRARALASGYGQAIDVALSESGSYVIPVLIPLQVPVPYAVADHTQVRQPIGRQISLALADSLQQLSDLATGRSETLRQDWILDRPALLALRDTVGEVNGREVSFEFVWSPFVDMEAPETETVVFDAASTTTLVSHLPELIDAIVAPGEALHAPLRYEDREELEYPLTFVGTVENLRRPRPTLRGDLHGRPRSVWVYLDEQQYQLAIRAHELRTNVRVVGLIRERGRATPTFVEVESFAPVE